jgi:adenine-specific DNA-methyltransferase
MKNATLFAEIPNFNLDTQGIKYAGSKTKLLSKIVEIAQKTGAKTVLDGFSGSTRVSQAFAKNGFVTTSNDIAVWSKVFGQCYLLNKNPPSYYKQLIWHLNTLPPKDGWFTEHYGGDSNNGNAIQADGQKKPWQMQNTKKLDAIREEIEHLELNENDKAVALTSLILALDKVDNTLGHYVSYLKDWSPRSYKTMQLEIPNLFVSEQIHEVLNHDIFTVVPEKYFDLAYFDPPYGSNNEKMPPSRVRYSSYYHLWTTICLNDQPSLFGKANRRTDTGDTLSSSIFEDFRKNASGKFVAVEAIEKLIQSTHAHFILLSYSSGGRATAQELNDALASCGTVQEVVEVNYKKNVMSEMKWTNEWIRDAEEPHREFLFLLEK